MKAGFPLAIAVALVILSSVSDFAIRNVGSLNWDVVLMLTPYGILRFWSLPGHYLAPYFDHKTPLTAPWEQPWVVVIIFVLAALCFATLERLRTRK